MLQCLLFAIVAGGLALLLCAIVLLPLIIETHN